MSNNIFLRDLDFYKRDLNPIQQYVEQSSFYVSKVKNISIETAKNAITSNMQAGGFEGMKDPVVKFYERHNYEDREITYRPLSEFLSGINTEKLTMAPSLTCYVNSAEKESLLSGFTDENTAQRSVAKKAAAKFKALGDKDKANHYNGLQENKKLYNNSLSGAFSSGGSIVRNPSAHSTLTSTTRTMTSIGNASNERLITGNRHYRDATITLNNIVVLAQTADVEEIRNTVQKFGLKVPTVDDVMRCIEHSTSLYWKDFKQTEKIRDFVKTLNDEERCSVVYTGDLFHMRQLNPEFIRTFLTTVSRKVIDQDFEDPISIITGTDEMYVNYVHQICLSEVRGINKDYKRIPHEKRCVVAATCLNLKNTLNGYKDLIRTFFLTRNLPPSVAYVRDSIRRSVVLSDTDSTMFSCDEWVTWYFNDLRFTDEAYGVSGAVMFMATQCIAHSLALYSANLNVEKKKLFMASMKPEFVFSIFALTSVGKHYYTFVEIKEGSVYSEVETEIKGVHLKNSASPKPLIKDARMMMEEILRTPLRGEKISLTKWVNHVSDLEREIKRSVFAGETTYLGRLNIKSSDAYKVGPEQSNFRHHLFWEEIFSTKYGHAPTPTYSALKFPSTLSSKKILTSWLEQIEDEDIRSRLTSYLDRTQRKDLNTIYISQDLVEAYGIPKEIKSVVDVDSMVLQYTGAHRLVLESIGFFSKHNVILTNQGY